MHIACIYDYDHDPRRYFRYSPKKNGDMVDGYEHINFINASVLSIVIP